MGRHAAHRQPFVDSGQMGVFRDRDDAARVRASRRLMTAITLLFIVEERDADGNEVSLAGAGG